MQGGGSLLRAVGFVRKLAERAGKVKPTNSDEAPTSLQFEYERAAFVRYVSFYIGVRVPSSGCVGGLNDAHLRFPRSALFHSYCVSLCNRADRTRALLSGVPSSACDVDQSYPIQLSRKLDPAGLVFFRAWDAGPARIPKQGCHNND